MKPSIVVAATLLFLATPSIAAERAAGADWTVGDLYATPDAWTASANNAKTGIADLAKYKGTLGKSAASMLAALDAISALNQGGHAPQRLRQPR